MLLFQSLWMELYIVDSLSATFICYELIHSAALLLYSNTYVWSTTTECTDDSYLSIAATLDSCLLLGFFFFWYLLDSHTYSVVSWTSVLTLTLLLDLLDSYCH